MINKKYIDHRQLYIVLYLVVVTSIGGCATKMVLTPQIAKIENASDFQMKGKVQYDGNKEYLPRTISDESASDTFFSFQYRYQITYGRDKTPQAIPLFNPLTIVGFPIGENTLVVNGNFTISKGKEVIKEYTATCGLEKVRSLFSEGETFSDLRKKGLLTVRDNIEAQMYQDRDFLSSLASGN